MFTTRQATLILVVILNQLALFLTSQAQPTRLWQRHYAPRLQTIPLALARLSPTRLVALGNIANYPAFSDTADAATVLYFFNNQGDTVYTRRHWVVQQITSQALFPLATQYEFLAVANNGELVISGYRQGGYDSQGVWQLPKNILVRTDSTGRIKRVHYFTLNNQTSGLHRLAVLPDGGVLLSCATDAPGQPGTAIARVARFDSSGAIVWQRLLGRPNSRILAMTPLTDGSYALAGFQGDATGALSAWTLRLTAASDTSHVRYWGTPATAEVFVDAQPAARGGVLLTGTISDGPTNLRGRVMELDSSFQVRWRQVLGGALQPNYNLLHGRALADGSVLLNGEQYPAGSLNVAPVRYQACYQPVGGGAQQLWQRLTPATSDEPNALLDISRRGEITVAGSVSDNQTVAPLLLTRLTTVTPPYVPTQCPRPPQTRFTAQFDATTNTLRLLDASGAGSTYGVLMSWHWVLGDGSTFGGPAPPAHRYASTPAATIPVQLTVSDNRGCSHTYTSYPFVLATHSAPANGAISLYPNPAAGSVTLSLTQSAPGSITVQLLNALGQRVRSYAILQGGPSASQQLDVHGLAAGIYIVQVVARQGIFRDKLLIQ